jgi:hypothetical protein
VGVDVEHRRVLAEDLELAVGLRLGPGEPVAVHVEAVEVAAGLLLAAVRVLDRQDDDDRVGEDVVDDAVAPRGEVVQGVERGVGAALLVAVDVAREPEDDRRRRQRALTSAWLASGFRSVATAAWTAAIPLGVTCDGSPTTA